MPELIADPAGIEAAGAVHCRPGEWVRYGSPGPEAPSTLPSASRRSRPTPPTGTEES